MTKCILMAAAICVAFASASSVRADDFDFSYQSGRFLSIPFEGVIYGLTDNATSMPTAIYVQPNYTLYTQETGQSIPSYADVPPYTFAPSEGGFSGEFTETAGVVTDGSFTATGDGNSMSLTLPDAGNEFLDAASYNYFNFNSVDEVFAGGSPFEVGPQIAAAPEPSTWLLMFAGIGGIGLMLRRAKTMGFRFKDAFSA